MDSLQRKKKLVPSGDQTLQWEIHYKRRFIAGKINYKWLDFYTILLGYARSIHLHRDALKASLFEATDIG